MIGTSPTNRSVSATNTQECILYPCDGISKRNVRMVPQPPKFRLPPPPNPLNFFNTNTIFAGHDQNEYSKEKFLLYFLSYEDEPTEKCKNLRIQLLANDPFLINEILSKTGQQKIKNSKPFVYQPANSTQIVNPSIQMFNQNSPVNQSSSFFTFFNIILVTITIFLLIGLVLLVIYLILLK